MARLHISDLVFHLFRFVYAEIGCIDPILPCNIAQPPMTSLYLQASFLLFVKNCIMTYSALSTSEYKESIGDPVAPFCNPSCL
jgi:hypothetical protein